MRTMHKRYCYCGTAFFVDRPSRPQKSCSHSCARILVLGGPDPAKRFWAYVKKSDGCWIWTGHKTKAGYGVFGCNGAIFYAHRFSFELHNAAPKGSSFEVCHRCDVPACVNPAHLFAGTHKENMSDAVTKGRLDNRGSSNGMSRLSESDVVEIRKLHAGGLRVFEIAKRFGLNWGTAKKIISGQRWRHVAL